MPGIILDGKTIQRSVRRVIGPRVGEWRSALTLPKPFVIQLVSLMLRVWRGILSSQRGRTKKVIRKGDMTTSKSYARITGNPASKNSSNQRDGMRRLKLLPGPVLLALACTAIALAAGCGGGSSANKITVQIIPGTTQMVDTGQSLTFMATLANDTSNQGVMWQFTGSGCSGAGCGTLTNATSSSVLYTAPSGISATLSVSLEALSLADKSATATVTIDVVIAPAFGTTLPPNGANGVPYSFAVPVTGGVAPLTLTIASGSLPAGLTISQSGTISGKPTPPNTTYTFKVQVADSGNPPIKVLSPQYTISISPPPPLSIVSSGALLGATLNTTYATSIVTSGGVTPFTWSKTSGNFPPGLTFNTTSGQLTGTPTMAGVFQLTLQVIDSAIPPQTATTPASLSITVSAPPPLQVTPSVLPGGTVATPYSTSVQATGGVLPYTWSVASGQLPAGLDLNPVSGDVTGTPILASGGPVSFTLGVKDSQTVPATASQSFSISITAGTANPNSLLRGAYAFFFSGFDTQGVVLATGQFTADGAGNISSGAEDMNRVSGTSINAALSGTYTLGTDGRGTLTLTATNTLTNQKLTAIYQLVLDSAGNARFFENDTGSTTPPPPLPTRGEGIIKPQVGGSFSVANFSGNYAFAFSGQDLTTAPAALVGVVHADGASSFSPGTLDFNDAGLHSPAVPTSGNFSSSSTAGRVVATLVFQIPSSAQVTLNFICYFVSPGDLFVIEIDTTDATHPKIGGEMILQNPSLVFDNMALSGASVISGTGLDSPNASAFVGLLASSVSGSATVNFNQNDGGTISQGALIPGTYSVTTNGRVEFTGFGALGPRMAAAYLTGVNQGFLVGSDKTATVGLLENQTGGPFTAASVMGSYALSAPAPADNSVSSIIGQTTANGTGTMQGVVDEVDSSGQNPAQSFVGNYSVGSSGQGTMTTNTPVGIPTNLAIYVASPSKIRAISTDSIDKHPQVIFFDH
jgi:large repetitive protein